MSPHAEAAHHQLRTIAAFLRKVDKSRIPVSALRTLAHLGLTGGRALTRTEILNAIERTQNTSNANYLLRKLCRCGLVTEHRLKDDTRRCGSLAAYKYSVTPKGLEALGMKPELIQALLP